MTIQFNKLFRKTRLKNVVITLIFCAVINSTNAEIKSGKCTPYYVAIKSDKVNSHVGPGKIYKVVFEYVQKYLPLMVVARYDNWRKIKDPDGDEGWVHKSMLSPKRFVITKNNLSQFMSESNETSQLIAQIKKNFVMELLSVRGNWCKTAFTWHGIKFTGWVKKNDVFGVFSEETW
jgi:SH3-like domain-containing protein